VRSGETWSQQAYLKASNTGANDDFGNSVAISGETIVVGANGEASNATGVNSDQTNNGAVNSGAAYVFVRSGETWSQQAYLKASNTGAGDEFGWWVGISGETVVVGARFEASNATGVNGDQTNNSAVNSGAAYIFTGFGNPPTIMGASGVTRQAGSPSSNSIIATVDDSDSGVNGVTVTINGVDSATVNGVTISNIVNTNGTVTADIVAACSPATNASFTLTATDGNAMTSTATLEVTVMTNTAPSLSYPAITNVVSNGSTTINASASDNGSIESYSIISVVPALSTAPTVDGTGAVTVTNAGPIGEHTITVEATDNCGLSSLASLTLNVTCSLSLPTSVASGSVGTAYSASVAATPGAGVSYSLIGGDLPPGLSLNPLAGVISGTPSTVGSFNFIVKAQAGGCSATQGYTVTISPAPRPIAMIAALIKTIEDLDPPLSNGTANSLLAKLNNALAELAAGDTAEARTLIGAFINQVEAQAGKNISQSQADELIPAANAILAALE
jgi:hypothetical protein